jgi:lipoate-protein ligase A
MASANWGCRCSSGTIPPWAAGSNCFASSTAADLVDRAGVKRIGSAQCWQHGRLLQHGEILLDPPPTLWKAVFGEAAPPAGSGKPQPADAGATADQRHGDGLA